MGSCTYFLKAGFNTVEDAKKAETFLNAFVKEAKKAYDYWQTNRGKAAKDFWPPFKEKFPKVSDYLKSIELLDLKDDTSNALSGKMDFGQEDPEVSRNGKTVGLVSTEVWHFTDWSGMQEYLLNNYRALRAVYETEEGGCSSLDSIQLYAYQEIVEALLKHPAILPPLMGLHEDLDALIEPAMLMVQ